jgi:hypothetical protein
MDSEAHRISGDSHFWQRAIAATAVGCILDSMFLSGFAITGAVTPIIPLSYAAVGLASCVFFYLLASRAVRNELADDKLALPLLVVSSAIQLGFVWLAPQVAFYFIIVLFLVFGSLSLSIRQSTLAWWAVAIILGGFLYVGRGSSWMPQSGAADRHVDATRHAGGGSGGALGREHLSEIGPASVENLKFRSGWSARLMRESKQHSPPY